MELLQTTINTSKVLAVNTQIDYRKILNHDMQIKAILLSNDGDDIHYRLDFKSNKDIQNMIDTLMDLKDSCIF